MGGFLKSLFGRKEKPEPVIEAGPVAVAQEKSEALSDVEPLLVDDETFEAAILNNELPALVDFWAPWCGPCRMIAPIVKDLAREYEGRAIVAKVDADQNVEVASQLGIMGIPTLVLFKNGEEVDRIVGAVPRAALEEKLQALVD
jgi:thioredoxin 1